MIGVIKKIGTLAGKDRGRLIASYVYALIEAILIEMPLLFLLYAIMKLLDKTFITTTFFVVLIGTLVSLSVGILMRYQKEKGVEGVGYDIFARERYRLGDHVKKLPMSFFTESNIGDVSSVITTDIKYVEERGMRELSNITTPVISYFVTVVFVLVLNWKIGLLALVTGLIFALIFGLWQKKAKVLSRTNQEKQGEVSIKVLEYIKGMDVVKSFHLIGEAQERTNKSYRELSKVQMNFELKYIMPYMLAQLVTALGLGGVIYVSGLDFFTGTENVTFLIMLSIFAFELFKPLILVLNKSNLVRLLESSLNRYEKILKLKELVDSGKDISLDHYDICLKDISFSYDKEETIHKSSFTAKENSMTALVGKSGCGKTTMTNLIARFWDVDAGTIEIGGVDVKDMSYQSLIANISMVFQNVYLFNDTIYNNIAFGNSKATREQVMEAAKKARCYDFIMALGDGFNTMVGEGGESLSGGEKQRISIARAILKDAPIILLDEATSSVDPDNETYIQEAINGLVENKTLVVIAHKLSTIKNADNIVVIEGGHVISQGKHQELMEECSLYARLWEKRMKSKKWQVKR